MYKGSCPVDPTDFKIYSSKMSLAAMKIYATIVQIIPTTTIDLSVASSDYNPPYTSVKATIVRPPKTSVMAKYCILL